jgi:hypothetical protein
LHCRHKWLIRVLARRLGGHMSDEREIWFPAKRYGWGWSLPCAWQGWAVLAAYLLMLGIGVLSIDPGRQQELFFSWIIGWSVLLLGVCWVKGERPRWRWGGRRD